ncbi:MAG TPA: hypothetical protein PK990_08960 [Salinivirgaceae bacterium]|nr:hypothetical protein [Salinivirgaceae bacterium]
MATLNLLLAGNSDSFKPYLIGLLRIRYKELILFPAQNIRQMINIAQKTNISILIADLQLILPTAKGGEYEQLHDLLKNTMMIVLHPKETKPSQIQLISKHFPHLKLLQKPFNPASLYHFIDSAIEQSQRKEPTEEINLPAWAIQDNLNLRVLCQNFRNDREKVIKILKLYPAQIETHLVTIEQILLNKQNDQLINELQSLKTSLIYFAGEKVVSLIDQIRRHVEDNPYDSTNIAQLLANFKNQWEAVQKQIQEL